MDLLYCVTWDHKFGTGICHCHRFEWEKELPVEDKGIPKSRNLKWGCYTSDWETTTVERLSLKICRAGTTLLLSHFLAGAYMCTDVTGVLDKPQPRQGQVIAEVSWSSFLPGHPCSGYRASREFMWAGQSVWFWGITSPHLEQGDGAGRALMSDSPWHQ